jgi:hypothetical protein
MAQAISSRTIVSRVIRPGDPPGTTAETEISTPEERMNTVWELTRLCLAWRTEPPGESRLQRSVVRIQRQRR